MAQVPTVHNQICIQAFGCKTGILTGGKCQIYLKVYYAMFSCAFAWLRNVLDWLSGSSV